MNDPYQDFFSKFLHAVDSVEPIRTIRVKFNTKLWFVIDVLNGIQTCDKRYKKLKLSGKEIYKNNYKIARFIVSSLTFIKQFIL